MPSHSNLNRDYALNLLSAYARAVRYKVLPLFDDLEGQAKEADENFRSWVHQYEIGPEDGPEFDNLMDEWESHHVNLGLDFDFVPRQMIGLVIAGVYHLWEQLSKWYIFELIRYHPQAKYRGPIQGANFKDMMKALGQLGWQVRSEQFFEPLNRARVEFGHSRLRAGYAITSSARSSSDGGILGYTRARNASML